MIRKLKFKFILMSAIAVFFVLGITVGAINIINYINAENQTQGSLTQILNFGPKVSAEPGIPGQDEPRELKEEHYFIVSFNSDGTIQQSDTRQMFILTQQECEELATKVFNDELTGGKYTTFRYAKVLKEDGTTLVGFLETKERFENCANFFTLSMSISAGAYVVLGILIFLGANAVFKPTEENYRKQKRFITNASHELKTPLTVISADVDLIEMEKGKSEWTESIKDQVSKLTEMTNQLVILSKLEEEDSSKFPFSDFALDTLCKQIATTYEPLFKKENIKFSYNFGRNLLMYGNMNLINQLINIFLENSLKYTSGENKSSYFVVNENNKGKIEFRFSNTLDKNDEVDPKQIMERFYRSPSNKKDGNGIGLSIAQEIVTLHHAKIQVDRNDNTISFTVKFN